MCRIISIYLHNTLQITEHDFTAFDWIFGMDTNNINELNDMKPSNCTAKIEFLGSYDPQGEVIIRDPYYVYIIFSSC